MSESALAAPAVDPAAAPAAPARFSAAPAPDPDPAEPGYDRAAVVAVADNLVRLTRSFSRTRARMLAAAEQDVERSAHILLKHLQSEGPLRAGALAEMLHFDPSTVSRQVAVLVKDGLLERRADPQDGRASLLVLTDRAHAVLADHNRIRLDYFAHLLGDWSDDQMRDFGALLERFNAAYESADHNDWLRERPTTDRPRSTT